jgi:hypothetical protein
VSIQANDGQKLTPTSPKCKDRFKWKKAVEEKGMEDQGVRDISVVDKETQGREDEDAAVAQPSRTNRYALHPCTINLLILLEYDINPVRGTRLGSVSTRLNRPKARQAFSRCRSESNIRVHSGPEKRNKRSKFSE